MKAGGYDLPLTPAVYGERIFNDFVQSFMGEIISNVSADCSFRRNEKVGVMRDLPDPKSMAASLKSALAEQAIDISHGQALETVAKQFGVENWNILSAQLKKSKEEKDTVSAHAVPIFRIFDEQKAMDFYLEFLGFELDWEHRFDDSLPLYAQVSLGDTSIHLSGHHGDASPGATAFVAIGDVKSYQAELIQKNNPNMRPSVQKMGWGAVMEVTDPFSNRIRFCELD